MDEGLKRNILIGVIVVALGVAGYFTWTTFFGPSDVTATANTFTLMDAETGKLHQVELTPDLQPYPHVNPKTGRATLYPTEVCWRGECLKKGGTHVILNSWVGKDEPTTCPVCGSGVRPHNPGPEKDAHE